MYVRRGEGQRWREVSGMWKALRQAEGEAMSADNQEFREERDEAIALLRRSDFLALVHDDKRPDCPACKWEDDVAAFLDRFHTG